MSRPATIEADAPASACAVTFAVLPIILVSYLMINSRPPAARR